MRFALSNNWLFYVNIWIIYACLLLIFALAYLAGYWLGNRASSKGVEEDTNINTLLGATLGLLGLLLAFTFSMSATRYETRKQLVVDEANALGTTYLRAKLLPEPYHTQASQLLRQYVALRLDFANAGVDPLLLSQVNEKTSQVQQALWEQAVQVGEIDPRSVTAGLFIQSLNESIDMQGKRSAALSNRVPESILLLLTVVSLITIGLIGYAAGWSGNRKLLPNLVVLFLIATILIVIIDLDRPRRGLITVSQQSMVTLQESINQDLSP
jgi:hypothetical protein